MAKTKIDERREREAYDKAHPWQPMASAMTNTGIVCELLFSDLAVTNKRYFLGEDDTWYQIEPPTPVYTQRGWTGQRTPMNWRAVHPSRKLTPGKRAEIIDAANKRGF